MVAHPDPCLVKRDRDVTTETYFVLFFVWFCNEFIFVLYSDKFICSTVFFFSFSMLLALGTYL